MSFAGVDRGNRCEGVGNMRRIGDDGRDAVRLNADCASWVDGVCTVHRHVSPYKDLGIVMNRRSEMPITSRWNNCL